MLGFWIHIFVAEAFSICVLPFSTALLIPPGTKKGFQDYCGTPNVDFNATLTKPAENVVNKTLTVMGVFQNTNKTMSEDELCRMLHVLLLRAYRTTSRRRRGLNGGWLGGNTGPPSFTVPETTHGGSTEEEQKITRVMTPHLPPGTGFLPVTAFPPVTRPPPIFPPFTGFVPFTGLPRTRRPPPVTTVPSPNRTEGYDTPIPISINPQPPRTAVVTPTLYITPRPGGLPPMFVLMRLLAKTILNKRTNDCKKEGGSYNSAVGVCVVGFKGNQSRLLEDMSLVDSKRRREITLAGNFFSIPALFTVLFVYGRFRELRNLPGKNMMCLSLSMLLVHVLQTIAIYMYRYPQLCRASGALLHWAYLVTFSWTSIIALDLATTFVQPPRKRVSKERQFSRYVCFGFTFPTVIVLAYVIVDASTNRLVGYGVANYCFIVRFWPSLSFLALVILVLLFNVVCVILATRAIHSSKKSTQRVLSKERYPRGQLVHLMLIVLKISTVVGLGWVFGILGSVVSSSALMYVYLILVNFQGVFVFFAFVCNRRIWRLCHLFYKANFGTRTNSNVSQIVLTNVPSDPKLTNMSQGNA